MPDEAPVLPEIEQHCHRLLAVQASERNKLDLLVWAVGLDYLCKLAHFELCMCDKHQFAALLFRVATRLQPYVFPDTTILLHSLIGQEGVAELVESAQREGWIMEECTCDDVNCPGYHIIIGDFMDACDNSRVFAELGSEQVLAALERFYKAR